MEKYVTLCITLLLACTVAAKSQCRPSPTTACLYDRVISGVPADAQPTPAVTLSKEIINDPLPSYPEAALKSHVGGLVLAIVLVGKDGHIEKLLAIEAPKPLGQASKDAIMQWSYHPILLNGEPTRAVSTVYLSFMPGGNGVQPKVEHNLFLPRISGAVAQGFLAHKTDLVYPAQAQMRRIGGTVVLHTVISEDGKVEYTNAISGPDELKDAAMDSVKKWIYRPFILNGEPTPIETTVSVQFNP